MSKVYTVSEKDTTVPMTRIHCKDEEKELQNLLEQNRDLLPGDQINPDDPRRWLLIKREMLVERPLNRRGPLEYRLLLWIRTAFLPSHSFYLLLHPAKLIDFTFLEAHTEDSFRTRRLIGWRYAMRLWFWIPLMALFSPVEVPVNVRLH
jgi:hypothetical protein